MNIKEKIKIICDEKGITFKELDKLSGLPQGSITRWSTNIPSIDRVATVASVLGVSIDYLAGLSDYRYLPGDVSPAAMKYESMDAHGKEVIDAVLELELQRIARNKALTESPLAAIPKTKRIPFIRDVAAGSGIPADVCWEQYEVPADSPADFAVKVNGDSMEPYFPDGEIFLGVKRMPQNCEIAFVLLDGEQYIKLYGMDTQGTLYLFSLNRERRDYVIKKDDARRVEIWGTIITDHKFTQPLDGPNDEDKPRKKRKR